MSRTLATLLAILWLVARDCAAHGVDVGLFLFSGACLVVLPFLALDGLAALLCRAPVGAAAARRTAVGILCVVPLAYAAWHLGPTLLSSMQAVLPVLVVASAAVALLSERASGRLGIPDDPRFSTSAAVAAVSLVALLLYAHVGESTLSAVNPGTERSRTVLYLGTWLVTLALTVPWALRIWLRLGGELPRRAAIGWSACSLVAGLVLIEVDRGELVDLYPAIHVWLGVAGVLTIDAGCSPWLGPRGGARVRRALGVAGVAALVLLAGGAALFLLGSSRVADPVFRAEVERAQIGPALLGLHPHGPGGWADRPEGFDHPALDYPRYHDYRAPAAPGDGFNLLLMSVDALRADAVPAPGEDPSRAPHLARLGSESLFFRRAYAPGTRTAIGLGAFVVGRYSANVDWDFWVVSKAGIANRRTMSADEIDALGNRFGHTTFPRWPAAGTLAERLKRAGYTTFATVDGGRRGRFIRAGVGFDRGFDEYLDLSLKLRVPTSKKLARAAVRQLRRRVGAPRWFQWIHFYDPHEERKRRKRYGRMVKATDAGIGRVLKELRRLGVAERTVVVVLADHGQALGEHRHTSHGTSLYDEQAMVPMILRIPGVEPRVVDHPASTLDAMATLLALGGASLAEIDGVNLLPLAYEGLYPEDRPVFTELHRFRGTEAKISKDLKAVIQGSWKLIHNRRRGSLKLFDLASDPGERKNVLATQPARAADLRRLLDAFIGSGESRHPLPTLKPRER